MKKIVYSQDVLGLISIWYDLHRQNKELHDQFMTEVFKLGYLEDITEVFNHVDDKWFLNTASGFVIIEEKTYTFHSKEKEYEMRCDERFHKVVEEFNQKLERPIKLQYKEIKDDRFPSMVISVWEDGSEHILFTD
jgi:hypothetical protein